MAEEKEQIELDLDDSQEQEVELEAQDDAQEASEVIMIVCLNENELLGRDGQPAPLRVERGLDRRGRDAARRRSALHDRVDLLR